VPAAGADVTAPEQKGMFFVRSDGKSVPCYLGAPSHERSFERFFSSAGPSRTVSAAGARASRSFDRSTDLGFVVARGERC
jgi:hypothetical protein